MTIRDRFRRALHKSPSSSNFSQQSDSNRNSLTNNITATTTTVSDSSESSSLRKTPSAKLFPWRSNDSDSSKRRDDKRKSKKGSSKPIHPRDKPLTATNLRHQEMLSGFNMTFGSSPSRLSQIVPAGPWDDFEGVSPCCTRNPSFDGGMTDPFSSVDGSSTSLEVSEGVPPPRVNASGDY